MALALELYYQLAEGGVRRWRDGNAAALDHSKMRVARHHFTPISLCPARKTPAFKRPVFGVRRSASSQAQMAVAEHRLSTSQLHRQLLNRVTDPLLGVVRIVNVEVTKAGAAARAEIRLPAMPNLYGYGWGWDPAQCAVVAMIEALERHAGMRSRTGAPVVRAAWKQIEECAINPTTLGLPTEEQYRGSKFLAPFDEDSTYPWVWAYSLTKLRPVLVHEDFVYYAQRDGARRAIAQESSSGCAAGSSIAEATLFALLELLERDAMLLAWYGRRPSRNIDLKTCHDSTVQTIAQKLQAEFGYDIVLADTTPEHHIPTVVVLAIDAHPSPSRPFTVLGLGAHLHHGQAVRRAMTELIWAVNRMLRDFPAKRHRAGRMFSNSKLVREMVDHPLANAVPEAADRFAPFLAAGPPEDTRPYPLPPEDSSRNLSTVVEALRQADLEVIVVDQTSEELRHAGLRAVKAIVPGLIPITFGADNVRLRGLPRVLGTTVASADGLRLSDIYHEPHALS